jgi:hypothetical protein
MYVPAFRAGDGDTGGDDGHHAGEDMEEQKGLDHEARSPG